MHLVQHFSKLGFCCRRIATLHFQLAICRADNIVVVGKFTNSFSLGNKIYNLSDTNPTSTGAVYKSPY